MQSFLKELPARWIDLRTSQAPRRHTALGILLLAAVGPARVDRTTEVGKKRPEACNNSLVAATEEGEHFVASASAAAAVNDVATGGAHGHRPGRRRLAPTSAFPLDICLAAVAVAPPAWNDPEAVDSPGDRNGPARGVGSATAGVPTGATAAHRPSPTDKRACIVDDGEDGLSTRTHRVRRAGKSRREAPPACALT